MQQWWQQQGPASKWQRQRRRGKQQRRQMALALRDLLAARGAAEAVEAAASLEQQ